MGGIVELMGRIQILRRSDISTYGMNTMEHLMHKTMTVGLTIKDIMKGKLPKWLQKQIESKTGWDYNGKRKSFFEQTSYECWAEGVQYLFADGTTTFEPTNQWAVIRDSVDSYEALYFRGNKFENSDSRTYGNKMLYWPILGLGGIYLPELGLGWAFVPVLFGG